MLVPFTVEVVVSSNATGASYVGVSVDTPLPAKINGTQHVIGVLNLIAFTGARFQTTVNANVGVGTHYIILGYEIPFVLIPAISNVRLKMSGAGTTVERTYTIFDTKQYVYIIFTVDKNGAVSPVSTGEIAPGGSPIASPGGGGVFSGDMGEAMMAVATQMMQVMLPLMMLQMMMTMMVSMIQGMMVV